MPLIFSFMITGSQNYNSLFSWWNSRYATPCGIWDAGRLPSVRLLAWKRYFTNGVATESICKTCSLCERELSRSCWKLSVCSIQGTRRTELPLFKVGSHAVTLSESTLSVPFIQERQYLSIPQVAAPRFGWTQVAA